VKIFFFEPIPSAEATRTDKPLVEGWFAVMTVETSANVVIDFNRKSVQATSNFNNNHIFDVFAIVELDNSPFSGLQFQTPGTMFTGDTVFVSANNVVVMNGTLGLSGHWGVHGNVNSNIHLNNLRIKDFEVRGIELNGLSNSSIKNIDMSGLEHTITTTSEFAGAFQLEGTLAQLAAGGFPGAAAQLASLQNYIATVVIPNRPALKFPNSDFGGLFVTGQGFANIFSFPTNFQGCALGEFIAGTTTAQCIDIENILVHDLASKPVQIVTIASRIPGGPLNLNTILLSSVGLFLNFLEWFTAFDQNGNFAPNALLQAQAFTVQALIAIDPPLAAQFPPNLPLILNSILTNNASLFFANVFPAFNFPLQKGIFAILTECSKQINLKNCCVKNIQNLGDPRIELASIPGAQFYPDLPQMPYGGNDAWAYEIGVADTISLFNCNSMNVTSQNGSVFGIDLINQNQNITVSNTKTFNMQGFSDNTTSVVNVPSEAYGLRVQNNVGPITITNHTSVNTTAPRVAFGLATEGTSNVTFLNCRACNTTVTATDPGGDNNKTAYGFYSAHSDITGNPSINTAFRNCKEKNSLVLGESNVTSQTDSIGAGYVFTDASVGGIVDSSLALNNHSGGGTANGVRIDMGSSNTTVSNNRLISNIADLPFATGFGVIDTAAHSTTTLINNFFANNSTANVSINP
jgi:hypothetical protein